MAKTLANILSEARHKLGLTQAQVAKKAGINSNAYAKIERGESQSRPVTLKKIARALEIDMSKIMDAIDSE
jgi:transcriptional regulator with XRE-family HTH domain